MSIRQRAHDAILGTFVADAAAAGLHWFYDVEDVARRGGDEPEFQPPEKNKYHSKRATGQFTHYGDHALVVLESVVERGGLDSEDYAARYRARFGAPDYDGYIDHATRDFLATGKGADDNQAGVFTKLPVLTVRYLEDLEFEARIEEGIRVTHDNTQAVRYGVAAACAIRAAVRGAGPAEVLDEVCRTSPAVVALVDKARGAGSDMVAFALEAGQTCPLPESFPVAMHAAYVAHDFKHAVRGSILSGGDTSGRLFVTAAIRGAVDGVPEDWLERMDQRARIEELTGKLLDSLPAEAG